MIRLPKCWQGTGQQAVCCQYYLCVRQTQAGRTRDQNPVDRTVRQRSVGDSPGRVTIAQKFLSRDGDHPRRIVNKDLCWRPIIEQRMRRI